MKSLLVLFVIMFPFPSQAITWKEFWKPFKDEYPKQVDIVCKKEIYYEQYNPSFGFKRWVEIKQIPCP